MTNVREAAVTAAAAAASVAIQFGATNINSVAQGAASASLATQRTLAGNANDDENSSTTDYEVHERRSRKRRRTRRENSPEDLD